MSNTHFPYGLDLAGAQRVATSATSAATTNAVGVNEVLIFATKDAWVTTGTNPTAAADTAGNIYLLAGQKLRLQINPTHKVAAIQDSAAGAVHVIPCTSRY